MVVLEKTRLVGVRASHARALCENRFLVTLLRQLQLVERRQRDEKR